MFAPNLQFPGDLVYNIVHPHKGDRCEIPMASPFYFLKKTHVLTSKKKTKDVTSLVGALSAVVLCEPCLPSWSFLPAAVPYIHAACYVQGGILTLALTELCNLSLNGCICNIFVFYMQLLHRSSAICTLAT